MKKPGPEKTLGRNKNSSKSKQKKREAKAAIPNSAQTRSPTAQRSPTPVDHSDIPSFYDVTRLVLMPRDPFRIFAYWEVSQSSIALAKKNLKSDFDKSKFVLRMYDVTCIDFNGHNANHCFDIEVSGTANNWYVHLWKDNVSYCADLGLITPAGRFLQIARSNFTKTPSARLREKHDEIWMEATQSYTEPAVVSRSPSVGPHARDAVQGVKKQRINLSESDVRAQYAHAMSKSTPAQSERKTPHPAAAPDTTRKKIYLSEKDIRNYYKNIYPLLHRTPTKKERLFRFDCSSGKKQPLSDPASTLGHLHGTLQKVIMGGASEKLVFPGASEQNFVSSAEGVPTIQQKDDFYFEIGTELIVYGRTRPDAEVWLEDKKIPLQRWNI